MTIELQNFERAIGEAKAGGLELAELVEAFLALTVVLPSQTDPSADGVTPVFVDVEGVPYLVVAASTEALAKTAALAEFAVTMSAMSVVAGTAAGLGLLVNTVSDAISFAPEILGDVRAGSGQRHGRHAQAD